MNVFIIGAGFTRAIFPTAPLNDDLLRALTEETKNSASESLSNRYKSRDIEMALTRLDIDIGSPQTVPQHAEDLLNLRRQIEREIAQYFKGFSASEDLLAGAPWLRSILDRGFTSRDVAVSLNYDCLFEGLLDCRGLWSPIGGYGRWLRNPLVVGEGFHRSPVTVLKIHGSANFFIDKLRGHPTAKAVNFDFDEEFFPCSAKNKHYEYGQSTRESYIIAPSYVKIPTVEVNYLMLDALTASKKARNLVIIGSALRREDTFLTLMITNFLHSRSWRERRIVIVGPRAEEIGCRLKTYWTVNVSQQIVPIQDRLENVADRLLDLIAKPKRVRK